MHAGYIVESGKTQIAFDPIFEAPFSRNCYPFPAVQFDHEQIQKLKFSAVFISHFHDDHCSFDSLHLLDRTTPIYMYCPFSEMFELIRQLGFQRVVPLEINRSVTIGDIEVIPRRALDADVDSMFQMKCEGLNLLNVVDAWIDDETIELLSREGPWDLVLWPFQTMREIEVLTPSKALPPDPHLPSEWRPQLRRLNPRWIVPSSCQFIHEGWSWYNHALFPISYAQFQKEMAQLLPKTEVLRMNPGASVTIGPGPLQFEPRLPWVRPIGPQDVDYQFDFNLPVPSTAEVAKHFRGVTKAESKKIKDYCQLNLLQKYKELEPSTEAYFAKPRFWQLILFNHDGEKQIFNYKVNAKIIEITTEISTPVEWLTELPAVKLLDAIENGEALTSMYVRVNDMEFSPEVEEQIRDVDVLSDPLIRCLFDQEFASYQKAQLKRWMKLADGPKK